MARVNSFAGRIGARARRGRCSAAWAFPSPPCSLLRWINPVYSAFMAETQIAAWANRDRSYVFRHSWVDLDRISPNLPLAVVASEDQKFPEHWGFDVEAIEKAYAAESAQPPRARRQHHQPASREESVSLVRPQLFSQGARGLFHGADRERCWPKRRILEIYLNIAEFGYGTYGAEAAAQRFFHKPRGATDAQRRRGARRGAAEPPALLRGGAVALRSAAARLDPESDAGARRPGNAG